MVMGPDVAYVDITETSDDPLPLYGAPIAIGNSLSFFEPSSPNPSLGFSAQASGDSGDITDGFLNLTIWAKPSKAISSISFSEGGDYTMSTLGDSMAQVSATMNVNELRILEVDGNVLGSPIVLQDIQNATFILPPDASSAQWDLSKTFDLDAALNNALQNFALGATKLTVKVNNTLTALSQPGSAAGIFKKDFDIDVETRVPEPTSLVLAAFSLIGVLATRRTG